MQLSYHADDQTHQQILSSTFIALQSAKTNPAYILNSCHLMNIQQLSNKYASLYTTNSAATIQQGSILRDTWPASFFSSHCNNCTNWWWWWLLKMRRILTVRSVAMNLLCIEHIIENIYVYTLCYALAKTSRSLARQIHTYIYIHIPMLNGEYNYIWPEQWAVRVHI